jgi:Tol biopolymer transport system component/predicted Ser/Thr protein kinase
MGVEIGQTISHYKILRKLGHGGMGEVYEAHDDRLDRPVALKVLKPEFVGDEERRERFLREAHSAAAVTHPYIASIYDAGEADGTLFIAMEYVEGQTVRAMLAKGPLPVPDVQRYATEIAEGLAKAHQSGLVHRDMKPDNVMVVSDGHVKILDFGLAKVVEKRDQAATLSLTAEETPPGLTTEGSVLGTPAYMSPEQARGEPVDSRSDIFSFGSTLYEMVTGKAAFRGPTHQDTLAAILRDEPEPVHETNPQVPVELNRITNRCVRKQPEERYNDTRDLVAALRDLRPDRAAPAESPPAAGQRRKHWGRFVALVAALVTIAVLIWVRPWQLAQGPEQRDVAPAYEQSERPKLLQVTFTGRVQSPRISPHGQFLAYVAERDGGGQSVFVQDLKGGHALEVFKAKRVDDLRWSPDGSKLLFSDRKEVTRLIPRLGGAPQMFPYYPLVGLSPDGTRFAGAYNGTREIQFVNVADGDTSSIALKGAFRWLYGLQWSPTGNRMLVLTHDGLETVTIWTIDVDGPRTMVKAAEGRDITAMSWGQQGRAVYYLLAKGRSSELWKVPVDSETGEPGDAVRLLTGLRGEGPITVTGDGKQMSFLGTAGHSNLWVLDVGDSQETSRKKQLTAGTHFDVDPSISPDGRLVAFSRYAGDKANIHTVPIDGGSPTQVTFLDSRNSNPVWSPNGQTLAFASDEGDKLQVRSVSVRGGSARSFGRTVLSVDRALSWAPGARILYQRPGNQNFHFLDPADEKEAPLLENDWAGWAFDALISPDGTQVAIQWNCFSGAAIWAVSLTDSVQYPIMMTRSGVPIRWSADGRMLHVRLSDRIVRVPTRKRLRGRAFFGADLVNMDEKRRRHLGLTGQSGVVVKKVPPRSMLAWEGLTRDDVILALDGHDIQNTAEFTRRWSSLQLWDRVALSVVRGSDSMQLDVTVQEYFYSLFDSTDAAVETVAMLPFDRVTRVAMSPDTTRIVCAVEETFADVWLLENFDYEAPRP